MLYVVRIPKPSNAERLLWLWVAHSKSKISTPARSQVCIKPNYSKHCCTMLHVAFGVGFVNEMAEKMSVVEEDML